MEVKIAVIIIVAEAVSMLVSPCVKTGRSEDIGKGAVAVVSRRNRRRRVHPKATLIKVATYPRGITGFQQRGSPPIPYFEKLRQ